MERIQNKVAWGLIMALSLLVVAALAGVVQGGPLDPTAPPGSTGKNVITSLPFTISQPGSYVLNGNLTGASGQHGVTVNAANVTIDLQGFELVGVTGALSGINGTQPGLTVRNGTIRNWPSNAVVGVANSAVEDVKVVSNNTNGINLGDRARVSDCLVENSVSGSGITLGHDSAIESCTVKGSGAIEILTGDRAVLENCDVNGTGAGGNQTLGSGIQVGNDSVVRGCTASNNGTNGSPAPGILVGNHSVLENCVANTNTGVGISIGADGVLNGCAANANGSTEITSNDGSILTNCAVVGFSGGAGPGDGILIGNDTTVRGCNARYNGGDGIRATGQLNRIEGNWTYNNNGNGIEVVGGGNVCMQNTAGFNGAGNYLIPGGNNCPVITGTAGATNPFANVQ